MISHALALANVALNGDKTAISALCQKVKHTYYNVKVDDLLISSFIHLGLAREHRISTRMSKQFAA